MSGTVGYAGRDASLEISLNGGSTYVDIPGVRSTGVTINNNPVDITNAASTGGWREMLAGAGDRAVDVQIDGVVSTGTAFVGLFAHVQNATIGSFRVPFANGGTMTFQATPANFQITGEYNGAQTFSCSLMSHRSVTFTAPT